MKDWNHNTRDQVSVGGGWLGSYRYGGLEALRAPVRFEATLQEQSEGQLTGEIIDDCALGYASIMGGQEGSRVLFSKSYRRGSRFEFTGTTRYRGILAESGTSISGEWSLEVRSHGILIIRAYGKWEARRMWSESEEPYALTESNEPEAANVPLAAIAR